MCTIVYLSVPIVLEFDYIRLDTNNWIQIKLCSCKLSDHGGEGAGESVGVRAGSNIINRLKYTGI